MKVAVLIPVLDRPARAQPVAKSVRASASVIDVEPYFVVSPGDSEEEKAVAATGAPYTVVSWEPTQGDYARKLNHAVRKLRAIYTWFLMGADDLVFYPGWIEHALAKWQETGACVIGTNDGGNRRVIAGLHSTHPLVHRDYFECGTVDEKAKLYHEGYWHNYCDDEFVQTALWRGTYEHVHQARVEHQHPDWGKGEMDETYRKGKEHFNDDSRTYAVRKRLWGRR